MKRNKPLETLQNITEPVITSMDSDLTQPAIISTSVLDMSKTVLEGVQPQTVVDTVPVIEMPNDQLPTVSQEESSRVEDLTVSQTSTTEITPKARIRKTLTRTNSLTLEKPAKSKETSRPRTIQRTQSLMNLQPQSQESDIIQSEEAKRKKRKEHSTKITLKTYLTTHKAEKKIERKNSQNNLGEIDLETSQVTNTTSPADIKTLNPFKKLTRALSDRDLTRKSDVPLTETVISNTLNVFKSKGIADWTRNGNTISATKTDNPDVHMTIHTHNKSDKSWSERPEIVSDFLEFSSECDEEIKDSVSKIGKKSSKK